MLNSLLRTWIDAGMLAAEAQWVIGLRMVKLAQGGSAATAEAQRMVAEKLEAFAQAQAAAGLAVTQGLGLHVASRRAMTPIRASIRKNRRRLSRPSLKNLPLSGD